MESKTDDDKDALKGLMRWIDGLKETCKLHVFFASSEEFFIKWIQNKLSSKLNYTIITDLKKNEAESYFNLITKDLEKNKLIPFEILFQLTGKIEI